MVFVIVVGILGKKQHFLARPKLSFARLIALLFMCAALDLLLGEEHRQNRPKP